MIRRRWIGVLAAMSLAAIGASGAAAVTAAQLRHDVDTQYYSGYTDPMTTAQQTLVFRDSILADTLLQSVAPLLLAGLLAGVVGLALHAQRAVRIQLAEGR